MVENDIAALKYLVDYYERIEKRTLIDAEHYDKLWREAREKTQKAKHSLMQALERNVTDPFRVAATSPACDEAIDQFVHCELPRGHHGAHKSGNWSSEPLTSRYDESRIYPGEDLVHLRNCTNCGPDDYCPVHNPTGRR